MMGEEQCSELWDCDDHGTDAVGYFKLCLQPFHAGAEISDLYTVQFPAAFECF